MLDHEEPSKPPEVEPGDEVKISTGCIPRVENKNAIYIKKLNSENRRQQAVKIYVTGGN